MKKSFPTLERNYEAMLFDRHSRRIEEREDLEDGQDQASSIADDGAEAVGGGECMRCGERLGDAFPAGGAIFGLRR